MRIVLRMVTDIQQKAFAHLIGADYARITRETTGQLVSRLTNDLAFIQNAGQIALVAFVRDVFSVVAVFVAMLYLDWKMTLIVLALSPLALLPMFSVGRRLRSVSHRTQTELGSVTSRLTEQLGGARLIKAFRLEDYATRRLSENFEEVFRLRMKAVRAQGARGPLAGGAGRHRGGRRDRALPIGASPAAAPPSATSWASSPRCCWRRNRCAPSARCRPPRPRAWLPPTASMSCWTSARPSSTGRAPSRSTSRAAPSSSTTSASPTALPLPRRRSGTSR